jgi:hypothetical protein
VEISQHLAGEPAGCLTVPTSKTIICGHVERSMTLNDSESRRHISWAVAKECLDRKLDPRAEELKIFFLVL